MFVSSASHKKSFLQSPWFAWLKITIFFCIGLVAYEFFINPAVQKSVESDCQLSSTVCQIDDANLSLEYDIVNPMVSNTLSVDWSSIPQDVKQLELKLEGHEMMMGIYKLQLKRTTNDTFSGELLLPFCTSETMTWYGTITPLAAQTQISPLHISVRMTQ
ncbi:hypothetical protein [Photobacterium jeanii]|nr:hypothetical protein [Photobacterium jeanii]